MADAPVDSACTVYSCRCLNVRIYPAGTQTTPPAHTPDPEYTHVYVGEDGIHVVHPHVTLRTRAKGLPIGGTSRCGRYTTLTCLVCEVLVYRVYQIVPLDIEGKDGPLLPTEEWVENEIMKSPTGWIEVSAQSVTNDAVRAIESSPDFSPLFAIVLPKLSPPSPTKQVGPEISVGSPRSSSPESETPISYLGRMKPLIPPAPLAPSHPVFLHLASKAIARSEILRAEAEEYISRIVQQKTVEVERAEDELREQVEAVWFKFKSTVDKTKRERDRSNATPRSSAQGNHGADSPTNPRVTVREFVPVPTPPARAVSPSECFSPSALSASLATSSFHHPKANSEPQSSGRETNGSIRSQSSNSSSDSATLVRSPSREGGVNVLQFPRNIDDARNTAVSFKYFLDLEGEIERKKKERVEEANRKYQATQAGAGPSRAAREPVNGKKPEVHEVARGKHVQVDTEGSIVESSERSPTKGKRHVTFDVEPEVVTINNEGAKGKGELNGENERESQADMIFELEDAQGESSEHSTGPKQTLPLLEQPPSRPSRHRKARSLASVGLPSSLSSLRPISLPPPSHIRPPRSPHGVDSSSQKAMLSLPKSSTLDHHKQFLPHQHALIDASENELDPRDAVILRLVAAGTPSHRGAWKPDSQAWKSFTRSLGKGRNGMGTSEDEADMGEDNLGLAPSEMSTSESTELSSDENGDSYQSRSGIPGSIPIPIAQLINKKTPLSLASYQPTTLLTERTSDIILPLGPKSPSAAALRRASYAVRDRQRAMDPGALDFAGQEDEGGSASSGEEAEAAEDDIGTRSRKRALRILQKSSEVPEEGMWRSLAA